MDGACNSKKYLAPPSGALGREVKSQISLNFNTQVNFKDFYTVTLCKDIKYIERDFCTDTWAMANAWDLGTVG